ncbi:CYTH domain-containing protein [Loigolactobacillus jiayinensis]|uniref:CYTH domain-containing protein n=1 Tax=Loigolactobacillus jiayinensis TaxID=2486016 RepID=A0ABW1R9Z5_9LACO|nr:CYTH domain-containing protein [Loigolactobacillus jiayinensis]
MSRQKEREFKNLLTAAEYQLLQQTYNFNLSFKQTNLYFDTATQQLRQMGCGLRIRLFVDQAEQTLKVPASDNHDLWELTDQLNVAVARRGEIQRAGQVADYLQKHKIDIAHLQMTGYAQTKRQQVRLPAGLLVLDQTIYADDGVDYELELEVTADTTATIFQEILSLRDIPQRPVTNKVARAVTKYQAPNNENRRANLTRMLFI